jgi:hypothetical protein
VRYWLSAGRGDFMVVQWMCVCVCAHALARQP